ncbi:MAG TPA: S-methyl-5-thioribose-1-phosphate isomerase [Candidatus Kryptonia bacterium]
MSDIPDPISWDNGNVKILDQTRLPHEERFISSKDYRDVCEWIKTLKIRGAPAIGIAAAYAAVLAAVEFDSSDKIDSQLDSAIVEIRSTRPTAVNLSNVLNRLRATDIRGRKVSDVFLSEAHAILAQEIDACKRIGQFGLGLVPDKAVILTHCHTGGLATGGYGTALGVIRAAHEAGKDVMVIVDETRPLLQGARLTTYELQKLGIKFKLIVDGASGIAIKKFKVDLAIVGADRIASNGDTANKIGTYNLSAVCKENGVPFYVAAPSSSFDLTAESGEDIPIEERGAGEVTGFQNCRTAPENTDVYSPAFDVTPSDNIAAFVTEKGIIGKPFGTNISKTLGTDL